MTGDIAHTGADEEYQQGRALIERLNAPIFALPGNHDDRARLRRQFRLPETGRADQAFAQIVGRHPNVQLIAAGHVHRLITATIGGAAMVAIPSTTLQIALDFVDPDLRLVSEPPCVAVHLLVDGRLVTHLAGVSSTR